MSNHDAMISIVDRLLTHHQAGSTDQASGTYRVPVSEYLDPEQWQREMDTIFRRKPLALALSTELSAPGSYKALDVMGTPALLVRDERGQIRAFVNACRHRGSRIVDQGSGSTIRFSCPYHAWIYDLTGSLVSVHKPETFGQIDPTTHGLTPLPVEERSGLVWVVLTPGVDIDLDEWLGDYAEELEGLELEDWHVFSQTEVEGPGWKVAFDGYLEGYHFASLHGNSIGKDVISNLMVSDPYGPHQRIVFARKNIVELLDTPVEQWDPAYRVGSVHSIFPNVSIANAWSPTAMMSQLFPGPTFDRSRTVQTILTREPCETDKQRAWAQTYADAMVDVVRDEDYKTGLGIQDALAAGANTHFTFGRNEPTLHHYHGWVDRLMAE